MMEDYFQNRFFLVNAITAIDKIIFHTINQTWSIAWSDGFFMFMRNPKSWYPLYILILLFAIWKMRKKAWRFILMTIVIVGSCDIISSHFLKPFFDRVRPCRDETLDFVVRNLVYCGVNGSFPSSHASNHFALAFFFFLALKPYFNNWGYLFFLWALIICYAQIYVGVHFPLDILGGMALGSAIGIGNFYIYKKYFM
ncbi:MAG: phosphatase PAP2 family protein [Chitinophagaceae bacterium]